ncbi:MAG: hypothetical protein ACE5HD_04220 [Acidobacteriota bacterium]
MNRATIVALCATGIFAAHPGLATDYYVDAVNGANAAECGDNNPTTAADRCKTIRYIIDNIDLGPNDTIHIFPGDYYEDITPGLDDGGAAGNPLTFRCEGTGCNIKYSTSLGFSQTGWKQCDAAQCGGDFQNVWYQDLPADLNGDGTPDAINGLVEVRSLNGDFTPVQICGANASAKRWNGYAGPCMLRERNGYWGQNGSARLARVDTIAEVNCEDPNWKAAGDTATDGCLSGDKFGCGGTGTNEGTWLGIGNRIYFNPINDLNGDGTISAHEAAATPNVLDTDGDGINDREWRVVFDQLFTPQGAVNDYTTWEGLDFYDAAVNLKDTGEYFGLTFSNTRFHGGFYNGSAAQHDFVFSEVAFTDGYHGFNCTPNESDKGAYGKISWRKHFNGTFRGVTIRTMTNLGGWDEGSTFNGPLDRYIAEFGANHGVSIAGNEMVFTNSVLGPAQEGIMMEGGKGSNTKTHVTLINSVVRSDIWISDQQRGNGPNDRALTLYNTALVARGVTNGSTLRNFQMICDNRQGDSQVVLKWAGVVAGGQKGGNNLRVKRADSTGNPWCFTDCQPSAPGDQCVGFSQFNSVLPPEQQCVQNCTEMPAEDMGFKTLETGFNDFRFPDHHLTSGSPLIDAGIDPSSVGFANASDVDRESRPQGSTWDIGLDEFSVGSADTTPPAAISTLQVIGGTSSSLTVQWTEVSDDGGPTGSAKVAGYEARWNTVPITDANFSSSSIINTSAWVPLVPSATHQEQILGLSPSTTYFIAIKSRDESANVSPLSNSASGATQTSQTQPPPDVKNLRRTDTKNPPA